MYVLGILTRWFKRMVLTLLILNSGAGGQASQDMSRSRLNAGMTFKHHTTLRVSESLWRVTFSVPLPKLGLGTEDSPFQTTKFTDKDLHEKTHCTTRAMVNTRFGINSVQDYCKRFVENVQFIRTTATRARLKLQHIAKSIDSLLPKVLPKGWHNERIIQSRAILGFVSEIAKSVFGFSTSKDLEAVRTAVNELITNHDIQERTLKSSTEHLATFATTVNKEFDGILAKINTQASNTRELLDNVRDQADQGVHFLANITLNTQRVRISIAEMENYFCNYLEAVELLSQGVSCQFSS